MTTWIGLLRGVNVGGKNILPMAKLKSDLESLRLKNVRTYIQSGNVIFDSTVKTFSSLAKMIGTKIEEEHGFRPHLLVLDCKTLQAAISSNPFPKAVSDPKTLHFFFLNEPASDPDLSALDNAKTSTWQWLTIQIQPLSYVSRSRSWRNASKNSKQSSSKITSGNLFDFSLDKIRHHIEMCQYLLVNHWKSRCLLTGPSISQLQ